MLPYECAASSADSIEVEVPGTLPSQLLIQSFSGTLILTCTCTARIPARCAPRVHQPANPCPRPETRGTAQNSQGATHYVQVLGLPRTGLSLPSGVHDVRVGQWGAGGRVGHEEFIASICHFLPNERAGFASLLRSGFTACASQARGAVTRRHG